MLTEGPQEDFVPPVQQQQQHEMPAQNEPVHDNTAGGDQGVCARALYDYQAGECRGSEWTATLCCVNMFVILLSVGVPIVV